MEILSLDLSTTTGFCVGDHADDATPDWGTWVLSGRNDLTGSFVGTYNEVERLLETRRPGLVVYETPLTRQGRGRSGTTDLLVGLAAVTRLVCAQNEIPCYEQGFVEVRKAVIGRGTFAKPFRGRGKIAKGKLVGDPKEEVEIWTRCHGWEDIAQPDARDAAVLFHYAQLLFRRAPDRLRKIAPASDLGVNSCQLSGVISAD
jgi:hypothetical protein